MALIKPASSLKCPQLHSDVYLDDKARRSAMSWTAGFLKAACSESVQPLWMRRLKAQPDTVPLVPMVVDLLKEEEVAKE